MGMKVALPVKRRLVMSEKSLFSRQQPGQLCPVVEAIGVQQVLGEDFYH